MLQLSLAQLRARYVEVLSEAPRTRNRVQLVRRIAWRLQAREHGDLSERAKMIDRRRNADILPVPTQALPAAEAALHTRRVRQPDPR